MQPITKDIHPPFLLFSSTVVTIDRHRSSEKLDLVPTSIAIHSATIVLFSKIFFVIFAWAVPTTKIKDKSDREYDHNSRHRRQQHDDKKLRRRQE